MTRTGFTTYFNFGIRSMASSPYGLFVGCSNPYGPDVAVRRIWPYLGALLAGLLIVAFVPWFSIGLL